MSSSEILVSKSGASLIFCVTVSGATGFSSFSSKTYSQATGKSAFSSKFARRLSCTGSVSMSISLIDESYSVIECRFITILTD